MFWKTPLDIKIIFVWQIQMQFKTESYSEATTREFINN